VKSGNLFGFQSFTCQHMAQCRWLAAFQGLARLRAGFRELTAPSARGAGWDGEMFLSLLNQDLVALAV
jgi:hypothetical protein